MKIYLKELRFNSKYGENTTYKLVDVNKCCDLILQNPLIELTKDCRDYNEPYFPLVALVHTEEIPDPYEDISFTDTTNYPIHYCPFCADKIEIEIVEVLDVTEEYNELENKRKETWQRHIRCDSKKKANELEQEVKELDKMINYYYADDNFSRYKAIED